MQNSSLDLSEYIMESNEIKLFRKNTPARIISFAFIVLAYIFISVAQVVIAARPDPVFFKMGDFGVTTSLFSGFLAQVKVMLTLIMTIHIYKAGAVAGVFLNLLSIVFLLKSQNMIVEQSSYLGVVVPAVSIIIIIFIFFYQKELSENVKRMQKHKEKILTLYEELAAAEEEAKQQNSELMEYNEMLLDSEKQLNFLAYYDVLTKLPNRTMTVQTLRTMTGPDKKDEFVVAIFDIDNFKRINDSAGHDIGDKVILEVSRRLRKTVSESNFVGRFSGDEFIVIMQNTPTDEQALSIIENMKERIYEPIDVEGTHFNLTVSAGVARYPDDGATADEMLKCADTAMYRAKESGKDSIKIYSGDMKSELMNRIIIEKNLIHSLENDEIFVVFQPQYLCKKDSLRGFEALVRWNSKALGMISPAKFIPVAESTKFINKLGSWILKTACIKFKEMCDRLNVEFVLSVNISAVQMMSSSFVSDVMQILEETGFNPTMLELEVTESVLISSLDYVTEILTQLKKLGIKVALDDFGTGFSSLSYLQKLPIDTLKIDKTFVDNIIDSKNEKVLVGSIISLVHKLGMEVIAEGVETDIQLDYLKSERCDYIQGYLLGKPLSEADMNSLANSLQPALSV